MVVFGEALTDLIQEQPGLWRAVPGGSCWNVARVAARLGVPTGYAGAVSTDMFGDELAALTEDAGLDMRFLQRVDRAPLLAMVASSNPPSYFFIGEGSADLAFDPVLLPKGWREAVEVVHFGGISLARPPLAARLVQEALEVKAAGKCIAFDPNFRAIMRAPGYAAVFAAMTSVADFIKVSHEDLTELFPAQSEVGAVAALRALAPDAVVLLTRGADGMTLFDGEQQFSQPAFGVTVADTVGCGDAVMGSWMASRLRGTSLEHAQHLLLAAASASIVAEHAGPYAPHQTEVDDFLTAHQTSRA